MGLINETCKLAGIERITPDNLDLNDWEVWKSIREDSTAIFQWESNFSQQILKELFSDSTIEKIRKEIPNISYLKLFSFGNALIRPCGASVRNDAIKGIVHKTGIDDIDSLLAPELGNCIVQETFMRFVMEFCGFNLMEADGLRKGIAKKKGTKQQLKKVYDGFKKNAQVRYNLSDEKCESIIQPILKCIEDASRYAFSWNHSDAYSFIGYACGWLRYYYPLEFLTTCLNVWTDKEDKTVTTTQYIKSKKITINPPKFRYSKSEYFMDKPTNSIYKGLHSIKFMNEKCAETLYDLGQHSYSHFVDLICDIKKTGDVDERQLQILIKLDFFSEFGNSFELIRLANACSDFKYGQSKSIKKEKITSTILNSIIERHSKATEKQYSIQDCMEILREIEDFVKAQHLPDFPVKEKIIVQQESLGYIDFKTNKNEDRTRLIALDIRPLSTKDKSRVWAYAIKTLSIRSGKSSEILILSNVFENKPFKQHDVIQINPSTLYARTYNDRKSWYLSGYDVEI